MNKSRPTRLRRRPSEVHPGVKGVNELPDGMGDSVDAVTGAAG